MTRKMKCSLALERSLIVKTRSEASHMYAARKGPSASKVAYAEEYTALSKQLAPTKNSLAPIEVPVLNTPICSAG